MADNVSHDLEPGTPLDIERFTHKSLQIIPDSGTYEVEVSNDNTTYFPIASTVTVNTLIRSGDAATDLPHCVKFIRITETVAGTNPVFRFQGHDPV